MSAPWATGQEPPERPGGRPRPATAAVALAGLVFLCLFVSACGGSSGPGVAAVGTTTSPHAATTTTGAPSPSAGSKTATAEQFAACMRRNGVPGFPDPAKGGGISITSKSGLDPNSPQFRRAQQTCSRYLPNGGKGSPQAEQKALRSLLGYARCMRRNGVPGFPDPHLSSGRITLGPGAATDQESPAFRHAKEVCRSALPGVKDGAGAG